jgi:exosortase
MTKLLIKKTAGGDMKKGTSQISNIWVSSLFQSLVFLTLASILFFPTIRGLVLEWYGKANASHGFFIPPIVCYLIWRKKDEIKPLIPDQTNKLILVVPITGLLLYLIGQWSLVSILYRSGFLIFLIGSVLFLIGKKAAKKILFPIAYSAFMIPLPVTLYDYLTFPLKKLATYASVQVISLFSIPVFREGNVIHLSNTTLEVVTACSGLNSVISVVALGTLWGYLVSNNNTKRWIFALSLVPIAISANIVRITTTALISNYYSTKITAGMLHEFSGAFFVLIVATLLMAVLSKVLK